MPIALIISRYFPPLSSAGASIRLVKFIKYIAAQNWKLIILTQDPDRTVVPEDRLSSSLEDEIPPETLIYRIPAPFVEKRSKPTVEGEMAPRNSQLSESASLFNRSLAKVMTRLFPGLSLWWGLRVFFFSLRNRKDWKVDLVYAVAPTFTNALIAALLRWFTGRPFVFDMKDDWVGSPDFQKKPAWRRMIEALLESFIISSAAHVVLATERSYKLYRQRYKEEVEQKKFHFIPNGCDIAEFLPLRNRASFIKSDKFLILSSAWGYQKNYRDITPFLLGLGLFFQNNPSAQKDTEVVFLGNNLSREYDDLIIKNGIPPQSIRRVDAVNRRDLIEWLWKSDLFFLVQPIGNTTAISGTLYEYWAVGKAPILLVAEEGASSKLVDDYHLGESFRFNDIKEIARYIGEIYQSYKDERPKIISSNGIEAFDRRTLALQMAEIWQKSVVANG